MEVNGRPVDLDDGDGVEPDKVEAASPRLRPPHRKLRQLSASMLSLAVLGLAGIYVVAPSHNTVSLAASDIGSSMPPVAAPDRLIGATTIDAGARLPVARGKSEPAKSSQQAAKPAGRRGLPALKERPPAAIPSEVIYGDLTATHGVSIAGATLTLSSAGHGRRTPGARLVIGSVGTYRTIVHLSPGRYVLKVSVSTNRRPIRASEAIDIADGRAYEISVAVSTNGLFAFLPVSSY